MFSNRWSGHGLCHCEHCRSHFKAFCGLELPRTGDPRDPSRRHYIVWRQQRLFELKGPYREVFPIGPLEVEIDLPAGARATGVKLLVAGQAVESSGSERTIRVRVPRVAVHEVVAVDLS